MARIIFKNSYAASVTVRYTTDRAVLLRKERDNLDGWDVMVPGYTLMEHPLVETEAQLWHSLTSKYVTLCTLHAEWSGPNARLPWLPVFCVARDHAESGPTRNAGTSHQGAQTRPLSGCASTCGSRPSTGRAFR